MGAPPPSPRPATGVRFFVPALAALLALSVPPAVAEAAAPTADERAAEEAFHKGREAMKRDDYAVALPLLRESQKLFPTPGTLLNLAVTEQKLGMVASAKRHFDEVARLLPAGDPRAAMARKEGEALAGRVPRLRIKLAEEARRRAEIVLALDGEPLDVDRLGAEIPVDPGNHAVTARAPGAPLQRHTVLAQEQSVVELSLRFDGRSSEGSASGGASARRTAGFVTLGVGAAALGVGAVTGVLALVKHAQLEDPAGACHAAATCSSLATTGKALSWASTVTLALGAAGAATGLYLVLSRPPGDGQAAPATSLLFSPRPGGGTLALEGAF